MYAKALCPRVAGTYPSLYPRTAAKHPACPPSHKTLCLTYLQCYAKHRARQLRWVAASAVGPPPGDDESIRAPSSTSSFPPQSALLPSATAAGDANTRDAATDEAPFKAASNVGDTSAVKRALKRALRGIDRTGHVVALMLHGNDSANPQQAAGATLYSSSSSSSSSSGGGGDGRGGTSSSTSTGPRPASDAPLVDDPATPTSAMDTIAGAQGSGQRKLTTAASAGPVERTSSGGSDYGSDGGGGGGGGPVAAVQWEASAGGSGSSAHGGEGSGGNGEGQGGLRGQLQLLAALCGDAEALCGQLLAAGEDGGEGKAAVAAAPAAGGVAVAGDRSELLRAQVRRIGQLRRAAEGVLREQQQQQQQQQQLAGDSATSAKGSRAMQALRRQLRISTFSPAAPAAAPSAAVAAAPAETPAAAAAADEVGNGTAAAGGTADGMQEARGVELAGASAPSAQESVPTPPPTPSSTHLRRHGPIRVRVVGPAPSTASSPSSAASPTYPPAAASSPSSSSSSSSAAATSTSASPPSPPSFSSSFASPDPAQDGAATCSSSAATPPAAAHDHHLAVREHQRFHANPSKSNVLAGLLAAEALNWCVLAAATHLFLPPGLGRWARWLCYSVSATKLAKGVAVSQPWGGGRGDGSSGSGQCGE